MLSAVESAMASFISSTLTAPRGLDSIPFNAVTEPVSGTSS